jgi:hypothetical protein
LLMFSPILLPFGLSLSLWFASKSFEGFYLSIKWLRPLKITCSLPL